MKRIILLILTVFSIGFHSAAKNKILVAGSGNTNILLIDKETGNIDWSHPLEKGEECNSVALTPDGNVIYSYSKGAKIVNFNHDVIWNFNVSDKQELQSVSVLKRGGFLLGICGTPSQLLEVDSKGKVTNKIEFDLNIEHPHAQFRQIRQSKNNNYLVPVMSSKKLIELNAQGQTISEFNLPGGPFSSFELKNGNLFIPCGDAHCLVEVDRITGKEVKRISSDDLAKVSLYFVAEISQLKNGNLMVSNWTGHSKEATNNAPQLFEIDAKNNIVWSLSNQSKVGMISAFYCLNQKETSQLKRAYNFK